jgi:hypothetical protein
MLTESPAHDGSIEIVICTGHGPQNLTIDDKGAPLPAKAPMSGKSICPYAPVGAVAVGHDAPHLLVQTVRYATVSYRITSQLFRATPRSGAQSARGPPATLI